MSDVKRHDHVRVGDVLSCHEELVNSLTDYEARLTQAYAALGATAALVQSIHEPCYSAGCMDCEGIALAVDALARRGKTVPA